MNCLDSRMFSKDWWAMPLPARYASIDAANRGLAISIEMAKTSGYYKEIPCLIWRGTAEQFLVTKTFPEGVTAKARSGKWVTPGYLRGTVYPNGKGIFSFVINGCNYGGTKARKHHTAVALADDRYLDFRDAVMAGFPMASILKESVP